MNVQPGDIGFGGKRKGFYPKAVRWFTRSLWSHCFFVTPEVLGEISVLEADLKVQLVPFQKEYIEKQADYWEVWRPTQATPEAIDMACRLTYQTQAGELYGFLQIPWFAVRAILRKLGMDLSQNWFPSGTICSETQWIFLMFLGGEYRTAFSHLGQDECSPEDIHQVVLNRPDLFTFVDRRV